MADTRPRAKAPRWHNDGHLRIWQFGAWSIAAHTGGTGRWGRVLHWEVTDPAGNKVGAFERLRDAKRAVENLSAAP